MKSALAFSLAGKIVTTARQATKILHQAIRRRHDWIIPQARSVRRQLEQAGQA